MSLKKDTSTHENKKFWEYVHKTAQEAKTGDWQKERNMSEQKEKCKACGAQHCKLYNTPYNGPNEFEYAYVTLCATCNSIYICCNNCGKVMEHIARPDDKKRDYVFIQGSKLYSRPSHYLCLECHEEKK
jgi:hypothetical protein